MKAQLARALDRLRCLIGAPARARQRNRKSLLVLMYHGVVAESLVPFCWHQLARDRFQEQIAWVAGNYTVLPLAEALARLKAGTLPDHTAAITFDDGFRNNLRLAAPVLEALDLPATIFLPTAVIGTQDVLWPDQVRLAIAGTQNPTVDASAVGLGTLPTRTLKERASSLGRLLSGLKSLPTPTVRAYVEALRAKTGAPADDAAFRLLDWTEVAAMHARGQFAFAAHTRTHPILAQCPDDEIEDEIAGSHADVVEHLGTCPRVFAYPNGRTIDFDARARKHVGKICDWALSTENGLADANSDPLALPRMCIGSDLSFDRFRLLVTGARGS